MFVYRELRLPTLGASKTTIIIELSEKEVKKLGKEMQAFTSGMVVGENPKMEKLLQLLKVDPETVS